MDIVDVLDKILLSDNVVEDFYTQYNSNIEFREALDNTIPEVKACANRSQNNPWHKYNVLEHILHSVEAMNEQTKDLPASQRRLLAYTMFFHDIGKPKCHIERIKDGKKIDSFFNHNIESARIAKLHAPELNFDEKDCEILEKLVYKHDIFMFIKDFPTNNPYWRTLTQDVLDEEIRDLNSVGDGDELMHYLIMVGKSDNLAQNEKMTAESLAMLDKMENMLEIRQKERK